MRQTRRSILSSHRVVKVVRLCLLRSQICLSTSSISSPPQSALTPGPASQRSERLEGKQTCGEEGVEQKKAVETEEEVESEHFCP